MNPQTSIAIIGAGHLGKSVLEGLAKKGHRNLIATRRNISELEKLSSISSSIILTIDNKQAAEQAKVIVLATKETNFEEIAQVIKTASTGKLLISLGPICSIATLNNLFGTRSIRLITPVSPGKDIICYTSDEKCTTEDEEIIRYIFGEHVTKIPEDKMSVATSYVLFRGLLNGLFEPLCDIGATMGFDEKLAHETMGAMLISAGEEISKGKSADLRLANASGGKNEQSFTMKLYHNLEPAQKLLSDLFQKVIEGFKR